MSHLQVVASFTLVLLSTAMRAQPGACTIDLGPDTVICQGGNVTLQAPPGFPNYLWNTGSTTEAITVAASGVYSCQVSYPSGELVTNGNFNAGNTGFTTQFTANSNLNLGDGHYWVGTNAASHHPQFLGTGTGNFLIVNSGWASALFMVWCQDVAVCPGQTYTLTYRARTVSNATPARLQWWIDGQPTGPEVNLPAFNAGWQTVTHSWTAPQGAASVNICLRAMSGEGVGNDFGLDDISMSATITLTDNVLVTVTPLPVVDLGPDATLCEGQNLVLDVGTPGGSYLWQDGSTGPGLVVSGPGDYGVAVTVDNCSASDALTVNYNPLPVADLGPDTTLCAGNTMILDVTQPGATYTWQNGNTSGSFPVTAPGTYSVSVWLNGCFATDAVAVGYVPLPTVDLGPDPTICAGEQVVLNATTPGANYVWQDGSTDPTFTATETGNYTVDVTVNGCTTTDAVTVSVAPLPGVDLGPDQTVCPGSAVVLDATVPGGSYLWQDGSTGAVFTAMAPGIYTVLVTANGCQASDAVTIDHFTLPNLELGPDVTICAGGTATFAANVPDATYAWSTGSMAAVITTGTAGTYWVDVTQNGCTIRDSVMLAVTPLPIVDLGYDPAVCPGQQAVLDATTPGGTYLWSTGATTPSINAGPGSYSVEVTQNGCTSSGVVNVTALAAPVVDLGPDVALCPGQQLVLNVEQPGAGYAWNTGGTSPGITVTQAGTYSVTLTAPNGCTASDDMSVTLATPQAIDLGPDTTICQGGTLILDASVQSGTYLWSNGATTAAIAVTTSGTYAVAVDQGGCTVNDAVTVTVVPVPVVDLGADATLCPGDALQLDATLPGATYLWSTGDTSPTLTVTDGGTYGVTVTLASGCSASDGIDVVLASPSAVDLGPDTVLCAGNTLLLDAGLPGAIYLWSTNATTPTLSVGTTGTYWVQVIQGTCSVSDSINVQVLPVPAPDLGPDQVLCSGMSTLLDATWPGATYLWNTGATSATLTVSAEGAYSVIVDLSGCTASAAVTVSVEEPPVVELGPDLTLCAGEQTTLDATTEGASYLWSTGSTSAAIEVATAGTYWVEVTQGTCTVTEAISLTVLDPGTFDLGQDTLLCEGTNLLLDATLPGGTYLWNDGSTEALRTVSAPGVYAVVVTVGPCSLSDSILVDYEPLPVIDLGSDLTLCPGEALTFSAGTPGGTYLWHDGSTGPTFTTNEGGPVSVTVTLNGCSSTDMVLVTAVEGPEVALGNDTTLCEGATWVLDVTQAGGTYLWDDGTTGGVRTVDQAGSYWVEVERNGCTASDTVQVEVFSPEVVDLGPDQVLCPGVSTIFSLPIPGADVVWSTGSSGPSISVDITGIYWVQVQVAACVVSDTVEVRVVELPIPDLGDDLVGCAGDTLVLMVEPGPASVLWSTGGTSDSLLVSDGGNYSVTLELEGCVATDAVFVTVLPFIDTLDLGPARDICLGEMLVLDATLPRSAEYLWNTGNTSTFIQVTAPGTYTVSVRGDCVDAQGTVLVEEGACGPLLHVPNAFTPNGDGINDLFIPSVSGTIDRYRFQVFDRWGELLFETIDPSGPWNGEHDGTQVQDGVYVWVVEYRSLDGLRPQSERLVGHVTLFR